MMGEITDATDQFLAEKADAIRTLARRSVFEIGKHLVEARDKCPHGKWLPWLQDEFGWSHTTADKYMAIYTAMKDGQIAPKLQFGLSISSLALLAAPSTPEEARADVAEQAKAVIKQAKPGKKIPHAQVKATVDKHRGTTKLRTKGHEQPGAQPSDAEPSAVERKQPLPLATSADRLKAPAEILEIARRVRARDTRSEIIDLCDWVISYAQPMVAVTAHNSSHPNAPVSLRASHGPGRSTPPSSTS
jgi:hypothetical protein